MATKKKDEAVEEKKADAAAEVKEEKSEKVAEEKTPQTRDEKPKKTAAKKSKPAAPESGADVLTEKKSGKRNEKVGVVWSDKMTKTVVVRVERTVKHSLYQKYMKRRKKFMAHDELGAATGDRVRIVETRPLSARKRWRVVEILQRAEK